MQNGNKRTVLFITGAFVGNNCWDEWRAFFESKGYPTLAPPWPGKEGSPEELRTRKTNLKLTGLTIGKLVDHYADIARSLPEKPILIGHSFGGLVVQLLLQRDVAAAGVAIHSIPPQGVIPLTFSFYKATWKPLGFFTSVEEPYLMSLKEWEYAFTNGMPPEVQKESWQRSVLPESKRASRGALTRAAHIDFNRPHAPLLFETGSEDNITPAAVNRSNYRRYKRARNGSITEIKEFPGHNHYVLNAPTWRENAEFTLNWVEAHQQD